MKCLPCVLLLLSSCAVYSQYLGFITLVGPEVNAPVSLPDGSPPGPQVRAQLFRVFDDGTLLPLMPTTTFQTDAPDLRLRYYVKKATILVPDIVFPDIFTDPVEITVRMRAWDGPQWQTSRWRGESNDIRVLIRNLLFPPANLVGLTGFTLEEQPRIAASTIDRDGTVQMRVSSSFVDLPSVVVERSNDLVHWEPFGEFGVFNETVSFVDSEATVSRKTFYRVKFR